MTKSSASYDIFGPHRSASEATIKLWNGLGTRSMDHIREALSEGADVNSMNERGVSIAMMALYHDNPNHLYLNLMMDHGSLIDEETAKMARSLLDSGETWHFIEEKQKLLLMIKEERDALEQSTPAARSDAKQDLRL